MPAPLSRAGLFNDFGVCTSASHKDLSVSPEVHQNFEGSTPELCSGVHQNGCDLEGVEGATPPTPNHSFKTMTTFNTDYNNTELLDRANYCRTITSIWWFGVLLRALGGSCD